MTDHEHADEPVQPVVMMPGEGRRMGAGPMTMFVIEDGSHTSGTHAVMEFVVDGQFSPPPHIHHQHEEVIYVLEGEMALLVRDETVVLGPGAAFVTPIGLPHTFSNAGTGTLRFLLTISPASHLAYFETMAQAMQEAKGTPTPETMMGIMQRYGLEPLRPQG
jgi:mannose-6-phosphate isomerase-like protein (cupin superfamily)